MSIVNDNTSTSITAAATATTTANVSGAIIDFDHTGITASGQTINNRAFTVALNSNSPTHVGTVNNFGITNSITAGTSGTANTDELFDGSNQIARFPAVVKTAVAAKLPDDTLRDKINYEYD